MLQTMLSVFIYILPHISQYNAEAIFFLSIFFQKCNDFHFQDSIND